MANSKIIQVTVTSTNYKKLGDYLKDYRSPAFPSELRNNKQKNSNGNFDWVSYSREFISWGIPSNSDISASVDSGENVILNDEQNYRQIENAFRNYPDKLQEIENANRQGNGYLDLPLKPGIKFYIPLEKVSREALLTHGVEVVSNNEPAFKAKALIELEKDKGYRKVFKQDDSNIQYGDIKVQYPDVTVWIWCRSLSDDASLNNSELQGQIFNITPFVTSINSSQTKNGGNFSIAMTPAIAVVDNNTGKWILKSDNKLTNDDDSIEVLTSSDLHVVKNINGSNKLIRNQLFFHNIISSNDLIFIRYETLENEAKQRLRDNKDFIIDKKNLAGRIYDLIGLVDRNTLVSDFETLNSTVNITGRDLSKLFIEDGSYFYSMENKEGIFYYHGGATAKNPYTQRMISSNAYLYLGLYYNNSIEDILKFVIQQLSTIKVVPNNLFDSYSQSNAKESSNKNSSIPESLRNQVDRRNKKINDAVYSEQFSKKDIDTALEENRQKLIEKKKEIIAIINKFRISEFKEDKSITVADINRTTPIIFDRLVAFIQFTIDNTLPNGEKIAKISNLSLGNNKYLGWKQHVYNNDEIEEDVFPNEFISNAIQDSTGLFFRFVDIPNITISFDKSSIVQQIFSYILQKKDFEKLKEGLNKPEDLANGIWQIVKLVIDKKVAKRLLIDKSISSASGSLMNYLKKIAQEPFVELFMDTYKDQFYIIVRQPPTDKIGMESYLSGNYQDVQNINETDDNLNIPAIIDIEEIDIANDNLSFDDDDVYSWYHFTPLGNLIANSTSYSTLYLPAIFFPEYAEIWGSKSLDLSHYYMNYFSQYQQDSPKKDVSNFQMQAFYDMKYLIESNQYLPFSRKGSITIKGGDRRIKVGNPIRLLSTGEIFWVDSVSHSFSVNNNEIERSTTIQISRGLNEAFIKGIKGSVLNELFKGQGFLFTPEKIFSYFNIINTTLNFSQKIKVPIYKEVAKEVDISTLDKDTKDYTDIQIYSDGNEISDISNDVRSIENSILNNALTNPTNEYLLSQLDPRAQKIFRRFLNTLEKIGWQIIITSGKRTYYEQYKLWVSAGKKNVAPPGTSKHETGFAIDINVIATKDINDIKKGTQLRLGGKYETGRAKEKLKWNTSGIPKIAKSMNIMWGGNYQGYSDNVHFQVPLSHEELEKNWKNSEEKPKTKIEYIKEKDGEKEILDEQAVFSNFQVDKEIFNFFLRKQQMGIISGRVKQLDKLKTTDDLVRKNIISSEQISSLNKNSVLNLKNKTNGI